MKKLLFILLLCCGSVHAQSADSVFVHPEHPATFPENNGNMGSWILQNLNWPATLAPLESSKLTISFVVEKNGRLSEIRVLNGGSPEQNRHIAGVVKSMPLWNPATDHGIAVRTRVQFPIQIHLQK